MRCKVVINAVIAFFIVFRCYILTIAAMTERKIDLNKVFKQHLEMEAFFAGDFTVKSGTELFADTDTGQEASDMATTLDKIATTVRACRKCEISGSRLNAVPGQGNPKAKLMFVG